jgi:two-component system, LytTR family, response regulator
MIKSVIVDDEDLARERIRSFLTDHADVQVAGEFSNGADALRNLLDIEPDLIFLDVQMPGMDGFTMLRALPEDARPAVIFVTAYDEHAIHAFEVDALDYLLKPFTKERFARAIERVRAQTTAAGTGEYRARLSRALKRIAPAQRFDRIPVKDENGTTFVRIDDVDWAESESNYVRIHAEKVNARLRETMEAFCERLPPERFIRIHRSMVVNLDSIVRVEPWAHGEHVVVLRDGTKLKSGRAYSAGLRDLLT